MKRTYEVVNVAGDTFTVVLRAAGIRPDAVLSVYCSAGAGAWVVRRPCRFVKGDEEWHVDLPKPDGGGDVAFKFHCDGAWEWSGNRIAPAADIERGRHDVVVEGEQVKLFQPIDDIPVANPLPARLHFPPALGEATRFQHIVIGSGMGGGIVAHELMKTAAVRGEELPQVLVLEAGGYLFATHVGNMPRRHGGGTQTRRAVWDLWYQYRSTRYQPRPGHMQVAQAFCLGGKSIFWGALIPPMRPAELAGWPGRVANDLRTPWYGAARDLLHGSPPALTDYRRRFKELLRVALPEFDQHEVQMAAENSTVNRAGIPSGIFSTAALLMEDRLREPWQDRLRVNLNHEVVSLVWDDTGTVVKAVVADDLVAGKRRTFTLDDGGTVVLAAGTVGSTVVAARSGIDHPKAGVGITDHPAYVWKSGLAADAPGYSRHESAKIVLRGEVAGTPLNVLIEMGGGLNAFMVDEDVDAPPPDPGQMPCEIVFFPAVDLVDANTVTVDQATGLPTIRMRPAQVAGYPEAVRDLGGRIIEILGGDPGASKPVEADLGAVGHEAGTLRMGETVADGVVDPDLKVYGKDNLYVCDLSVFPTSPAANPSLTLAALAMRLAAHLSDRRPG
jgi:choline dehydrogenase-like flavoprotein